MIGSSGAPSQTISAAGDLIELLVLLAKPNGLAKVTEQLREAHQAAVTEIDRVAAQQAEVLAAAKDEHEKSVIALAARQQDVETREETVRLGLESVAKDRTDLANQTARLEEKHSSLAAAEESNRKLAETLTSEREAHSRQMADRRAALVREFGDKETAHDARVKRHETDYSARLAALEASERKFSQERLELNDRMTAIAEREAAAAKIKDDAEALRLRYQKMIADLQLVVGR